MESEHVPQCLRGCLAMYLMLVVEQLEFARELSGLGFCSAPLLCNIGQDNLPLTLNCLIYNNTSYTLAGVAQLFGVLSGN